MASLLKAKRAEIEKLTDANIAKVIRMLEAEKPCTKKLACETLNIAYNVTRLDSLIAKYKERKEAEKARRASKRGTELSIDELGVIASEYMEGKDLMSISKTLARTVPKIKQALEFYGIPKRGVQDYLNPALIPDSAVALEFRIGEKVWSARYESMAEIVKEVPHKDEKVYRVWLEDETWQQYAYQPASELASLKHLTDIGIKL
jgi:hypothetical protein